MVTRQVLLKVFLGIADVETLHTLRRTLRRARDAGNGMRARFRCPQEPTEQEHGNLISETGGRLIPKYSHHVLCLWPHTVLGTCSNSPRCMQVWHGRTTLQSDQHIFTPEEAAPPSVRTACQQKSRQNHQSRAPHITQYSRRFLLQHQLSPHSLPPLRPQNNSCS